MIKTHKNALNFLPGLYQSYITNLNKFIKVIGFNPDFLKIQNIHDNTKELIKSNELKYQCVQYDLYDSILNNNLFLAVPYWSYDILKPFIDELINNYPIYIRCEIPRIKIHNDLKYYIVVALLDERQNINDKKSVTRGYAKKIINKNIDNKKQTNCIFCECKITEKNGTTEHIIPFSKCNNNSTANFVVSCYKCNNERGTIDFWEFLATKKTIIYHKQHRLNKNIKLKRLKIFI